VYAAVAAFSDAKKAIAAAKAAAAAPQ